MTNYLLREHAKHTDQPVNKILLHLNPGQLVTYHFITLILIPADKNPSVYSHHLTYDHPTYSQQKLQPKFP